MSQSAQIPAGTVIAERYVIDALLGERGDGALYTATVQGTSERICLRISDPLPPEVLQAAQPFHHPLTALSQIQAPNLLRIIAFGIAEEPALRGRPWIATELLQNGQTLDAQMKLLPPRSADALAILRQVASALAAIHQAGFAHGRLKPGNIYLTHPAGEPQPLARLMGFGLSRRWSDIPLSGAALPMGGGKVTPMWMAPEQAQPDAAPTPAGDVFTLGLLGFYLLARRSYWRAVPPPSEREAGGPDALAILNEVLTKPLPSATVRVHEFGVENRLPEGFDAWFEKCVQRDPHQRFVDASAALAGLAGLRPRRIHSGQQMATPLPSATSPGQPVPTGEALVAGLKRTGKPSARSLQMLRWRRWLYRVPVILLPLLAVVLWVSVGRAWWAGQRCETQTQGQAIAALFSEDAARACGVACEAGQAQYCARFADWLLSRRSHSQFGGQAALLAYQRACSSGQALSCRRAGELLSDEAASPDVPRDVVRARGFFDRGCERDDVVACRRAGQLWLSGPHEAKDAELVLSRWGKACSAGELTTCVELGRRQLYGNSLPKNEIAAAGVFRQACDAKSAAACFELARQMWQGLGIPRRRDTAVELLQTACSAGHFDACVFALLSRLSLASPGALTAGDVAQLGKGCETDSTLACAVLGLAALRGWGQAANPREALSQWQKTCQRGIDSTCMASLVLLQSEWSPVRDSSQAVAFRKQFCAEPEACASPLPENNSGRSRNEPAFAEASGVCRAGQPAACLRAARMAELRSDARGESERQELLDLYERGCAGMVFDACIRGGVLAHLFSIPSNKGGLASADVKGHSSHSSRGSEAAARDCAHDRSRCSTATLATKLPIGQPGDGHEVACGNAETCLNMGLFFRKGMQNVRRDDVAAVQAFRQGCELNNAESCYLLSLMYRQGHGVRRDASESQKYLEQACRFGHSPACGMLVSDAEAACDQGQVTECVSAGLHFLSGDGVPKDAERGKRLLRRGCSKRVLPGCEQLDGAPDPNNTAFQPLRGPPATSLSDHIAPH